MIRGLLDRPRFANWLWGFKPPEPGRVTLSHRRVYILPTREGWMYAATLGLLLVGSINYSLQLGFALTFLLAGTGFAAMVHTARNLARIVIVTGRAEPVFAGESAQFRIYLENRARHDRPSILLRHLGSGFQLVTTVPAEGTAEIVLKVPTARRGWCGLGRVMLETRFPLGIFRAWSYFEPDFQCLVYPRPEYSPLPAQSADAAEGAERPLASGRDDFSGLRGYQLSDSPRHVAWKAVARSDEMLTKQFSGEAAAELWLDARLLPPGLDPERRLSRLTGWVLSAAREGARYGLRLDGLELGPERGDAHRSACLRALALHGPTP